MDFFETLQKRYSSRQYTAQPVESEKIEKLLEAAQRAPAGMHHYQDYGLTVISDRKTLDTLCSEYQKVTDSVRDPLYKAPLLIVISAGPGARSDTFQYDAGCMMENMHLTAVSLGLGSVFIRGMFRSLESDSQAQKMLQVPADWKALCGLAAGYDPAMSNHPAVFHSLLVHRIE